MDKSYKEKKIVRNAFQNFNTILKNGFNPVWVQFQVYLIIDILFIFSPCNNNHQQQNSTSWESKNIKKGNIFFWKTSLKKGLDVEDVYF